MRLWAHPSMWNKHIEGLAFESKRGFASLAELLSNVQAASGVSCYKVRQAEALLATVTAVPVTSYSGRVAGSRLANGEELSRTSARISCRSGPAPASHMSPPGGSSRRDDAYARMAATARRPDQRCTHPTLAAARSWGGRLAAQWRARWRRKEAVSTPKRPPTSTTTSRARRALTSSRYVWRRFRRAAACTAAPGGRRRPAAACQPM